MSRFHIEKEDATRRCNGRSFRQTYPKAWTSYFKYLFCVHPPCRKAQGSQDCWPSRHEKWAHPQVLHPSDLPCRHFPPSPWILQLPSFSSSSSSSLWHWSETPTGHTVGNEIKTGICKDHAFLDSLIGQMLSWGSGHLSTQALPVPNRSWLAELLRERGKQLGTANPKSRYTGTWKDLMMLTMGKRK